MADEDEVAYLAGVLDEALRSRMEEGGNEELRVAAQRIENHPAFTRGVVLGWRAKELDNENTEALR